MIRDDDTISQAVNKICEHLPEGWRITISLESDAGDVELTDQDGDDVDFPSNRETFAGTLRDALEYAMNGGAGNGLQGD